MAQYIVINGSFEVYCYRQNKPEGKKKDSRKVRLLDLLLESSKDSRLIGQCGGAETEISPADGDSDLPFSFFDRARDFIPLLPLGLRHICHRIFHIEVLIYLAQPKYQAKQVLQVHNICSQALWSDID
jgi:hypothetical protein